MTRPTHEKPAPEKVSRVVAHALRHEPWSYGLEPDDGGWVPVADLLDALHGKGAAWRSLRRQDLVDMIASSAKRRYELEGDHIRALYGHSLPGKLRKVAATPPDLLYHGTSPRAWEVIRTGGLAPMTRQYVHLSVDVATAVEVGRRRAPRPVIIHVRAREAFEHGVRFYEGNETTWLADAVPARFLAPVPGRDGS